VEGLRRPYRGNGEQAGGAPRHALADSPRCWPITTADAQFGSILLGTSTHGKNSSQHDVVSQYGSSVRRIYFIM
jgi:hypothetical protein